MKYFKKHFFSSLLLFACLGFMTTTQTSCKTKEGCPTNEYTAKTNKKGDFKSRGGSSQLFPKKMRKKVKRKKG